MYGALSNNGILEGKVIFSDGAMRTLHHSVSGDRVPPPRASPNQETERTEWGRMALGFGPWETQLLHGAALAPQAFGHSGVGGCVGFSCPRTQLSVCVMKNTYEPISCVGDVSPDVASIVRTARRELQAC